MTISSSRTFRACARGNTAAAASRVPRLVSTPASTCCPIVRTAREKLGREIVTNMVALGCVGRVLELEKIASPDSLRKVVAAHFPVQKIADLNLQAFDAGYEVLKQMPLPD